MQTKSKLREQAIFNFTSVKPVENNNSKLDVIQK